MLGEWKKRIEPQKRLSLAEMAAESETTLDVEARKRALQVLPLYFKKIIGPYELRVYWFEVFECIRKVCLVGLPVWFRPGTPEQLVLGLIICFISFGAYMYLSPFTKSTHDVMSQLCQFQIFFALLAGVVLKTDPTELETAWLGTILTVMCAVPPFIGILFNNDWVRSLFDAKRRHEFVSRVSKWLLPIWDRLCRGRSSKTTRSKARAANAWRKSFKASNAQDNGKARSFVNLLGPASPSKAGTPVFAAKLAATRGAATPSASSLLDKIKMAKAAEGGSAETDLEAPSLVPTKRVSFIAAAAAAAAASEPGWRARVAPSPIGSLTKRVAPPLGAIARAAPQAAPDARKLLDLESHLTISPRQTGAERRDASPSRTPVAVLKTPTQSISPSPSDIHVSDM